jgi:hypothetical protein
MTIYGYVCRHYEYKCSLPEKGVDECIKVHFDSDDSTTDKELNDCYEDKDRDRLLISQRKKK